MKRSRVWIGLLLGLVVIAALVVTTGSAVGLVQKGIESAGKAAVQQQMEKQLQQHVDGLAQERDQVQRQLEEQGVHLSTQDDQPPHQEAVNGSDSSEFTIRTPGSVEMDATGTCLADTTSGPIIDMNFGFGGEYRVAAPGFSCNFEDEH